MIDPSTVKELVKTYGPDGIRHLEKKGVSDADMVSNLSMTYSPEVLSQYLRKAGWGRARIKGALDELRWGSFNEMLLIAYDAGSWKLKEGRTFQAGGGVWRIEKFRYLPQTDSGGDLTVADCKLVSGKVSEYLKKFVNDRSIELSASVLGNIVNPEQL
ncbi:MAG TPA: hypothetical protein VJH90_00720 [archaeon]|nr:hypothetical protein [archaeon]